MSKTSSKLRFEAEGAVADGGAVDLDVGRELDARLEDVHRRCEGAVAVRLRFNVAV